MFITLPKESGSIIIQLLKNSFRYSEERHHEHFWRRIRVEKASTMNRRAFPVQDAELQVVCAFAVQYAELLAVLLVALLPCQA